ncbi:unnamed protein product, partial [Mesorhabditis spiculigera]
MREPPSEAFTLPGHDNALCEHGVIHPPTPIVEPSDKYTVVKLRQPTARRCPTTAGQFFPRHPALHPSSSEVPTVVIAALTHPAEGVLRSDSPCPTRTSEDPPDEFTPYLRSRPRLRPATPSARRSTRSPMMSIRPRHGADEALS